MTRRALPQIPAEHYSPSLYAPPPAPRTGVVLTGFWRIKTMVDVAMANDLYYRAMALRVNLVVPILHLQDEECWLHLAEGLRDRAVVWRAPLEFSTATQRPLMESISDSAGQQWVWEADLDERLRLDDLAGVVARAEAQGADYVPGDWIDCFREDRTLAAVATNQGRREADLWGVLPERTLEEQFPARGYLVRDFSRACPTKVALHRYDCLTTGGNHRPREATKKAADFTLPILHFKWHAGMIENAQEKAAAARRRGQPWFAEQERCLELEDGKIPARFSVVNVKDPSPIGAVIATHYAAHCNPAWLAVDMDAANKLLAGYDLPTAMKTDLPAMMAIYCRLIDEAGLCCYGHTEAEAVAACKSNDQSAEDAHTKPKKTE